MGARTITTVMMPATNQSLTTLAALKVALGLTDNSNDVYLEGAILAASAEIARYCGRTFKAETLVDRIYLDAYVGDLILSRMPLISVTSVIEDGTPLIVADDYVADCRIGTLVRIGSCGKPWLWPAETIVVTYVAGYASVPADLEKAAQRVISAAYMARQRDPSIRSVKIPDLYEAQYWVEGAGRSSLPADVLNILDSYRLARL